MAANVIGLDIGGANLKAATAGGSARSGPFELWKHPEQLSQALLELLDGWRPARLAVTMTGELCDCFESKRDGVQRILAQAERAFPAIPIGVWSTHGKFVSPAEARQNHLFVAAANWHALATMVGKYQIHEIPVSRDAESSERSAVGQSHAALRSEDSASRLTSTSLLIDVGSTTSDVIPLVNGVPCPIGATDPERLLSKELVYTGVKRTPICALVPEGIMAEFFATTQDVYLLLGMIPEDAGDRRTADGRPATAKQAHARLARMLGGDAETIAAERTHELAARVYIKQQNLLAEAIGAVTARLPAPPEPAILSGSGEFLARSALATCGVASALSLAETLGPEVSSAACAYAVAFLAEDSWLT